MSWTVHNDDGLTAMRQASGWLFDLDNTLYPASCRLFDQIDERMGSFIMGLFKVGLDEAKHIQKTYFYEYGTTLNGLMERHDITPDAFLDYVHDIDVTPVDPHPDLGAAITALPGRKAIYTNGTVQHAENVLDRLGIGHCFDGVFDIVAADFEPKPKRNGYEAALDHFGFEATRTVMVEDIARNLVPAKELGLATLLVPNDYAWAGPAADRFKADDTAHAIDVVTHDLKGFLQEI